MGDLPVRFVVACMVLLGAGTCNRRQPTLEAPPADALESEDLAQYPDEPEIPEEIVLEAEPEFSAFERDLMLWQVFRIARGTTVATDAQVRLERGNRLQIRRQSRWFSSGSTSIQAPSGSTSAG